MARAIRKKKKTLRRALKREQVVLVALDGQGRRVKRCTISLHDYYDDLHDLLDSAAYRARFRIREIRGELLDAAGQRYQQWWNWYSARGVLMLSRVIHADGAVSEQDHEPARDAAA